LMISAALFVGQVYTPATPSAQMLPPLVVRGPAVIQVNHEAGVSAPCSNGLCGTGLTSNCRGDSTVTLFKCWTTDALKMEPVEHKAHCTSCEGGFLSSLLYCPKEPEKKDDNGDKKDDNGDKKEARNHHGVSGQLVGQNGGNGEKKDEEKKDEE